MIGIVLPAVATTAGANPLTLAAMAVIAALVIYSSNNVEIERRYPRTSRVFRHYTRQFRVVPGMTPNVLPVAFLIDTSKILFGSEPPGTLNPNASDGRVVYVEEPPDNNIACPPTAEQSANIARAYELPLDPGETPDKRANAYIEFEITRVGYWEPYIVTGKNTQDANETGFRLPFLYYGPYAVAIRAYGSGCY